MNNREVVSNWYIYGYGDSIAASKYPMAVDTESCDSSVTKTTHKLASCAPGTGHDQFLTGIIVQFDLTLSNKAWVEAERYHFLDFVSSQSTMHRAAQFDIEEQVNEYVTEATIAECRRLADAYREDRSAENYLRLLYNLPSGFRLTARMTTNYRQLKTIYHQRKNHRLPEWREFCRWMETLPGFKELVLNDENS
jgi:hypothetical protein